MTNSNLVTQVSLSCFTRSSAVMLASAKELRTTRSPVFPVKYSFFLQNVIRAVNTAVLQ